MRIVFHFLCISFKKMYLILEVFGHACTLESVKGYCSTICAPTSHGLRKKSSFCVVVASASLLLLSHEKSLFSAKAHDDQL